MTNNPHSAVRALYRSIVIPKLPAPYNTAGLKIHYPASFCGSDIERNTGQVNPIETNTPFPIVIMMPGINIERTAYGWLAHALAQAGIVTVTYNFIAEEMPGYIGITPGLDLAYIRPETFGQAPSSNVIAPIIDELIQLNQDGLLAGCLDINTLILGGHSGGGTAALLNANRQWFPAIKAAFTYGAHTGASTLLGFSPNTVLPVDNSLPLLLLGGTEDGCIAESNKRYDANGQAKLVDDPFNDATARIEQCFEQAIAGGQHDKYLLLIKGANHFSAAFPKDTSTGRDFIDRPEQGDGETLRLLLSQLITHFIVSVINDAPTNKQTFDQLMSINSDLIAKSHCK